MKGWAELHGEFMKAGRQTTKGMHEAQLERYLLHIMEEAHETLRDWNAGDRVRTLDGLCDTIVVCMGAIYSMGINPEDAMRVVLNANTRKIVDGKPVFRADGQIGKPEGWYGPERELGELIRISDHEARGIE